MREIPHSPVPSMRSRICSELSSRKPSWPAFNVRARKQAGHMDASDLIKALQKHLARRGPSTYGECRIDAPEKDVALPRAAIGIGAASDLCRAIYRRSQSLLLG